MFNSVITWQSKFFAQPKVYYTYDNRFHEPTGNYYDSEEAAQLELDWEKAHSNRSVKIMSIPIHNLELSRERWGDRGKDAVS